MPGPKNASLNGDGFRFYEWKAPGQEPVQVLSVTSVRKLCGESFNLVNWQLANLADAALGTMKRTVIGPRGGVKEIRQVFEYPSEFAEKYDATLGEQAKIDDLRKWLRAQADEPRNVAARRGTMVHEAIEKNVAWDRIELPYVEAAFASLSQKDRTRAKNGIVEEDVHFVRHSVRQYWAMRQTVPFIILAREVQVWNLQAGYAGSPDALVWFLPEGFDAKGLPKARDITLELIRSVGGYLAVGDWKTAKDIHTDNIVQVTAYGASDFVGSNGVVDQRLTDILHATTRGVLFHIRPNKWGAYFVDFSEDILQAFLGSVAFARFLARYPHPDPLWVHSATGSAGEEVE